MIFKGAFEDWDPEENHESKLVFIGKNLDGPGLRAGFAECLATDENMDKKLKALRFKVGERVRCNMGGGEWQPGTVRQLMWRDEDMEQGQVCPYKVSRHSTRTVSKLRTPACNCADRVASVTGRVGHWHDHVGARGYR